MHTLAPERRRATCRDPVCEPLDSALLTTLLSLTWSCIGTDSRIHVLYRKKMLPGLRSNRVHWQCEIVIFDLIQLPQPILSSTEIVSEVPCQCIVSSVVCNYPCSPYVLCQCIVSSVVCNYPCSPYVFGIFWDFSGYFGVFRDFSPFFVDRGNTKKPEATSG